MAKDNAADRQTREQRAKAWADEQAADPFTSAAAFRRWKASAKDRRAAHEVRKRNRMQQPAAPSLPPPSK